MIVVTRKSPDFSLDAELKLSVGFWCLFVVFCRFVGVVDCCLDRKKRLQSLWVYIPSLEGTEKR